MKTNSRKIVVFLLWAWCLQPFLVVGAQVDVVRTQTIVLQSGWNAVFLEVEPASTEPSAVLAGTPVDIVARYFPVTSSVQFISNPADLPWNEPGWGVWYATNRADAFLTSLHAIQGHKAYLVHATANYTWRVSGKVTFKPTTWQADSFNLLGFTLDEQAPPSFQTFFAGASGAIGQRIYRLDSSGRWQPVSSPGTTLMRSGEAYWIYCQGRTDYQGPLDVTMSGVDELDFGQGSTALQMEFCNRVGGPIAVTLEIVSGAGDLPLARVVRDPSTFQMSYPALDSPLSFPALQSGTKELLKLQPRREAMTAGEQVRLLRVSSNQGVCLWIPVRAQRPDLTSQP